MNSNWYYRILALVLAVLCWYLVTGREWADTWVQMRVEIAGLGDGLIMRDPPRDSLDVLVRGPKGLVRKIDPALLIYSLDARNLAPGINTVVVDPDSFAPLSKLFKVVEIRPSKLEIAVERRQTKTVPVRIALKDSVQRDYRVAAAVEPVQVSVSGPESVLREVKEVVTQAVSLPDEPAGKVELPLSLVLPDQVAASPRLVKVTAEYRWNTREAAVETPVRLAYHGKSTASVQPEAVVLKLKAPVTLLREGAWRGLVDAFVDVDSSLGHGRHELPYRVTLPQGCELLQARPERVVVTIK